jgi:sugar phosphate isomerase/epimerase
VENLRVGIHLGSLRQPFKQSLQTAARLGANAVEIDARSDVRPEALSETAKRQLRKLLDDLNLRVCAIEFQTRRGYNVLDDLDRRIEATKSAMDMAYALGAAVVVNSVGQIPENAEEQDWELLIGALSDIGRHGQKCGATLAARSGGQSGTALRRLLDALPDGSIGVDFDPGRMVANGFSASQALQELSPNILHVHARDAVRDLAEGRGLEVPLGQGVVDFPEMLAKLSQADYRGYFTVKRSESRNPTGELGDAIAYLRNLVGH